MEFLFPFVAFAAFFFLDKPPWCVCGMAGDFLLFFFESYRGGSKLFFCWRTAWGVMMYSFLFLLCLGFRELGGLLCIVRDAGAA